MESGAERYSFMRKLLEEYQKLRGKPKNSLGKPFWDVVVITTVDAEQKEAFRIQIDGKVKSKELPTDLPIHIIADPPGIRIGNGGSTLTVLEDLEAEYGQDLFTKKMLLIHAGGWSQRMPSCSILGKIFSLLPHGNSPYQMLDFKLALYWPFVEKIEPGIFLVCADDFLVYSFGDEKDWRIPGNGFTALAHPSSITLGRTHGVYVLPNANDLVTTKCVILSECEQVLQKPNDERMKSNGAVLEGDVHKFADGINIKGEAVYTDSCFYFGVDVMKKLLRFKKNVGTLSCEIDAYGDFLQAVGKKATSSYINNTGNISQMTSNLLQMRLAVFNCLNGSDIHVLILNASAFIHVGTTSELMYHFCRDVTFQKQLALGSDVFNVWNDRENVTGSEITAKRDCENVSANACIMHSALHADSEIGSDCVIEFCDFQFKLQISPRCILSNCQLISAESKLMASNVNIPTGTFLHTIPINLNQSTKYVTIFFNVDDNLKKSVPCHDIESLPFLGSDIGSFINFHGFTCSDLLPTENSASSVESKDVKKVNNNSLEESDSDKKPVILSLWNLKLYPAMPTMTSSLEDAISSLALKQKIKAKKLSQSLFSVADLLKLKDVRAMLNFRKYLYEKILSVSD